MNKDLRQFLQVAKEAGPDFYVEVKRPLKPELEVCVLQDKFAKEGRYPVIYAPEIEGSRLPLITNVFGSYELLGLALGLDHKKTRKAEYLQEYMKMEKDLKPPQTVPASDAPIKEIVLRGKDIDLGILPITKHCEHDSGKYISIGCLICKDPDTGIPNTGVYRHEVKGKDRLGCGLHGAQHAAYVARHYAELGKPMEVVIFIGHHPAVIIGSQVRGDINLNELEVMGGLLGEPLRVTPAETVDLPVPADAEIAIEGIIDPRNMVTDGPFGEYFGYYGIGDMPCYLLQVTAISMRKEAIYHDLHSGHIEHNLAGIWVYEATTYDLVKRAVPTVKAVRQPPYARHNSVYVSIKKCIPGEGQVAGLAALMDWTNKIAVVVDEDIDIFNEEEVQWAIATRVKADQDISIIPMATGPMLDPCSYDETRLKRGWMRTKLVIDATKPVEVPFAIPITPSKELWESMNLEDYIG